MARNPWMAAIFLAAAHTVRLLADDAPAIGFLLRDERLVITAGEKPLATYCFADEKIARPYFAHVHAPGGPQVTRNHPPIEGRDALDHAELHPGLWLSFGDLSGNDYWRLKARTEHAEFVEPPAARANTGRFAVRNRYLSADGKQVVCQEIARYTLIAHADRALLLWDSTFSSPQREFVFGDQEEMGLGVRVATPLSAAAKAGGRVLNSDGRRGEAQAWGKQAAWCDYGGPLQGRFAGITVLPHPGNFRPSWFHARDYGLLAANPFGQRSFSAGEASRVAVKPGEKFRLRFGVLIYNVADEGQFDRQQAYREYVKLAEE